MNLIRYHPKKNPNRKAHGHRQRSSPLQPKISNWSLRKISVTRNWRCKKPWKWTKSPVQSMPKKYKSRSKLQSHLMRHLSKRPTAKIPPRNLPKNGESMRPRQRRSQACKTRASLRLRKWKSPSHRCKKLVVCLVKMPALLCLPPYELAKGLKMRKRSLEAKLMTSATRSSLR